MRARIDKVLAQTPLIDGHNDLPWEIRARFGGDLAKVDLSANTAALPVPAGSVSMMTDIPRLRRGHVGAQLWSVYVPVEVNGPLAVQETLEQIDLVKAMCARYSHDLAMAYSAADIMRLHRAHLIASWSDADLARVAGGNLLRVLSQAESVSARLRGQRSPSAATLEALDGPLKPAGR